MYQKIIKRLVKILHTKIRHFDAEGNLIRIYGGDNDSEDRMPGDNLIKELFGIRDICFPRTLQVGKNIVYSVISDGKPEGETFVVGPMALKDDTRDRHSPYAGMDFETYIECILLLSDCFSGQQISVETVLSDTIDKRRLREENQKQIALVEHQYQETARHHNPYSQEEREQACIENGDVDGLRKSIEESYSGTLGTLGKNLIRHHKNLGIVNVSISTRAAIRGGLHPEIAYTLSDAYILRLEELHDAAEIHACFRSAEFHFCRLVNEAKMHNVGNALTFQVENFIQKNIRKRIKVADIAEELHVTPDHLSKVFKKAKGIPVSEYILREKIRYAKEQLVYSEMSMDEIAYHFGFSSQSHFGTVFKKQVGVTPAEYRKRNKAE